MIQATYTVWCDHTEPDGTPCNQWVGEGYKDEVLVEAARAGWATRRPGRRDYCPKHTPQVRSRPPLPGLPGDIERARRAARMSQTVLADRMKAEGLAHWHQTTVSRVEQGQQQVRPDELDALTRVLGLTGGKR